MLTRLRDQVGTAGLVVAIVALVAALGGGAYAASKGLNSTQKKEVKNIAKSFQGTGPQGAAGPAGAPGAAGAKGDIGAAGAPGVSPAGSKFTGNKNGCPDGGIEYKGATTNSVCNGGQGPEGSPWTAGGTLPEGETETGAWVFSPLSAAGAPATAFAETDLSFPIPLENEIPGANVHFEPTGGFEGAEEVACPGSVAKPEAEAGHLCVYRGLQEGEWEPAGSSTIVKINGLQADAGASRSGAILFLFVGPETRLRGTWAVTAP
jgi:hypothetical protein